MRTVTLAALGTCVALAIHGCAGDVPSCPAPLPTPVPTPELTPTPTPEATPAPEPTPSVTLALVRDLPECHPHPKHPCDVPFTATGENYDTLAWTGCCEGSSGTTGICIVEAVAEYACTVTAKGSGGSASDSAVVTGVNDEPQLEGGRWGGGASCDQVWLLTFLVYDDQYRNKFPANERGVGRVSASGYCTFVSSTTPRTPYLEVRVRTTTGHPAGTCSVGITWTDPWGSVGQRRVDNPVSACP